MNKNRKWSLAAVSSLCAVGVLALSVNAQAAVVLPKEYTLILLDGSGSMLDKAKDYNGMPSNKWQEGIRRATTAVQQQKNGGFVVPSSPDWDPEFAAQVAPNNTVTIPRTNNCYAIWRFGNTLEKLYPPAGSGLTFKCADNTTEATRAVLYDEVDSFLKALTDPGAENLTPLAGGLCDALSAVRAIGADSALRSVILESDGLENNTPSTHACQGDDSTFNPAAMNGSTYLSWAGGSVRGTWPWRVYTVAALDGFNAGSLVADRDFLTNYPIPDSAWNSGVLGLKPGQTWLSFYKDAFGFGTDEDARTLSKLVTLHIDALYDFIPDVGAGGSAAFSVLGASSAAAVAGGPTDTLKAFMRTLSTATKGRFQKIQYKGALASRPGLPHTYPGDVGDNGCVDMADYNAIRQPDVYNRPSSDSQIASRYDANRDGWVDINDATLVLKNRGCGKCQGSSGPLVPCKYGI